MYSNFKYDCQYSAMHKAFIISYAKSILFYVNPEAGKSITNVDLISGNIPTISTSISFFQHILGISLHFPNIGKRFSFIFIIHFNEIWPNIMFQLIQIASYSCSKSSK